MQKYRLIILVFLFAIYCANAIYWGVDIFGPYESKSRIFPKDDRFFFLLSIFVIVLLIGMFNQVIGGRRS